MKIHKYGVVIVTEGPIKVEDWVIEREASDPEGATENQLILAFAIPWAQQKFRVAVNQAVLGATILQKMSQQVVNAKLDSANRDIHGIGCDLAFAPPRCERHKEQMVLQFYERPGGPAGNGWVCQSCAQERAGV